MLEKSHGWWDREVDQDGRRIRSDVRVAAHEIWQRVRIQTESVLGDPAPAAELLELSVVQASRYLDGQGSSDHGQNQVGLLLVIFWRLLERRRAKLSRLESAGDITDLSDLVAERNWTSQIDNHLDCQKIVLLLSVQGRTILALRTAGYGWVEIGQLLNSPANVVKGSFWREIRQISRKIASKRKPTADSR